MHIEDLMLRVDTSEPILVEWVLDRLEEGIESDAEKALEIEGQLFNDMSISYMINNFDELLLTRIFRIISPERFVNNIELLSNKWIQWEDAIACWSAPVIASCSPGIAFELIRDYCQKGEARFDDLNKWHGIMKGVTLLPTDQAKKLSEIIIDSYRNASPGEDVKQMFSLYLPALAWTYDHPDFELFFREHILPLPTSRSGRYSERLAGMVAMFEFSSMEYDLVCAALDGVDIPFSEYFKLFYDNAILPETFEDAISQLKKRSFSSISSFFADHGNVIENSKVRDFFKVLIDDQHFMTRLHRKKQQPYIYAMILSCMMASLRKETISLSGVGMDRAVAMLSSDLQILPDIDSFISYFKALDKENTIQTLTAALEEAAYHFGGKHVITVMDALGYDAFLKPLTDALFSEPGYDFINSRAEAALVNFGEKTLDFFVEQFNDLEDIEKISALNIVSRIGGSKAVDFVDMYFDALWKQDKEGLLDACETLCSERWREKLKEKTNKGQTRIDRTYLLLSMLNEKKSPETETLLQRYYETQKERSEMSQAFRTGNLMDTIRPFIEAELRCKSCGDENIYPIHRIIITDRSEGQPYIAEELRCLNCKLISEFEFTSTGMMVVTSELMRMMLFQSDEERREAYERSPIEIIPAISKGKSVDIGKAIEGYQAAIESDPKHPDNHIGLGNIYFHTHQYTKAAESFLKAVDLDPLYIEPYYSLAQISNNTDQSKDAFKYLEQGRPYLATAKFLKGFTSQIPDFIQAYCDLHQSLLKALNSDDRPIHPSDFTVKANVGRNDPCPCGSGKKYKKCCLNN